MMGAHLKRTAVAISQGGSTDPPFIVLSLLHSGFFPFHPIHLSPGPAGNKLFANTTHTHSHTQESTVAIFHLILPQKTEPTQSVCVSAETFVLSFSFLFSSSSFPSCSSGPHC